MFFRKSRLEPLPITMTGVRMGERLLQIGVDDRPTIAALAKKVGMSGTNALAASNEADAERARRAAADAGVFIDVRVTPWHALPFDAGTFDVAVVHAARGWLTALPAAERVACLQQARRMLRRGGRIVVIEAAPRAGLSALLRGHRVGEQYAGSGGAEAALRDEGFRPVRVLGEVEGYKFTEGLNT